MTLGGTVSIEIDFRQSTSDHSELSVVRDPLLLRASRTLSHGDGAGQVNCFWHDERTLAPQATDEFNLYNWSLIDPATGLAIRFETVRMFYVRVTGDATRADDEGMGVHQPTEYAWQGPFGGDVDSPGYSLIYPSVILATRSDVDGWVVTSEFYKFEIKNNRAGGGGNLTYEIAIIGIGTRLWLG